MTCEPLPENASLPMELPSMSSAAASRARTFQRLELELGLTASAADYGLTMLDSLASFDPLSSSWKTSQLSLVEDLTVFSETWPRSGMMRSGIAYPLPTLAHLTAATESGSWPTPRSCSAMAATITPQSVWAENRFPNLETVVGRRLWPTPNAGMEKHSTKEAYWRNRVKKGRQCDLQMAIYQQTGSGSLNPAWVEWLMGFPDAWTDLSNSETP
jgi:hypothetical protein